MPDRGVTWTVGDACWIAGVRCNAIKTLAARQMLPFPLPRHDGHRQWNRYSSDHVLQIALAGALANPCPKYRETAAAFTLSAACRALQQMSDPLRCEDLEAADHDVFLVMTMTTALYAPVFRRVSVPQVVADIALDCRPRSRVTHMHLLNASAAYWRAWARAGDAGLDWPWHGARGGGRDEAPHA